MIADIKVRAPFQRVTYVHGRSFSHSALHALQSQQKDKLPEKALRLRKSIMIAAMRVHRQTGGDVLAVVPKAVEGWIRTELNPLPPGVHLAHHGAVAGRDEWKDVRAVMVVGRPMPAPSAVARIVGALTGEPAELELNDAGYYPSRLVTIHAKNGGAASVEVAFADSRRRKVTALGEDGKFTAWTEPDTVSEAARAAISVDQVEQAIGRGRGVNRDAKKPVDVFLLGTGPVDGLEVDSIETWEDPTPEEAFACGNGVWLENITHMATVMGFDRHVLRDARTARGVKSNGIYTSITKTLHTSGPTWRAIRYQCKGAGQRKQTAYFAPGAVADPKTWLEEHLGPVEVELIEKPVKAAEAIAETPPDRAGNVTLPDDWRARLVLVQRGQGWTQSRLATEIGIARPTLANALGDRYDLGRDTVERVVALLNHPPPPRQAALF